MVLGATALWGINGSFAKATLSSGLSSLRLTEVRSTGAALILVGALAITRPRSLRITRGELPFLLLFGVAGLAFVQLLYFVAIHRLEIGVALLIQYVAPVLIALWARLVLQGAGQTTDLGGADPLARRALVRRRPLERRRARRARSRGRARRRPSRSPSTSSWRKTRSTRRDPVSLLALGFTFAALFWALVQPWWSFPTEYLDDRVSLDGAVFSTTLPVWALLIGVVLVGTIVPFLLLLAALRHLSATRAGVTAMFEPVAGAPSPMRCSASR